MIKLKEIRKQKQFTQEQVAKILNVNKSQICNYEKEKNFLNSQQIIKLCNALNCSADQLLGLIDIKNKKNE